MNILYAPYAAMLPNRSRSPKDYPFALALAKMLEEKHTVIQVGSNQDMQVCEHIERNRSFDELREMIEQCDTAICVDSYLQHLMWYCKKPAVVIWGPSDPKIFGHPTHINLLKDQKYLRPGIQQFQSWMEWPADSTAFVAPSEVLAALTRLQSRFNPTE